GAGNASNLARSLASQSWNTSRRDSGTGPRKRLPTEEHRAAAEQRPAHPHDDAALAQVGTDHALRDEARQDRADDSNHDVGQRARSRSEEHDPATEPTGG